MHYFSNNLIIYYVNYCTVHLIIILGHTRQGLKCRLCKMNVHIDCQERASKCQTKSRLLRRQKSSSEIETRTNPGDEEGNKYKNVISLFEINLRY